MEMNNPILLVEDDKNLGYILSEYLTMKGFEITWAKDGVEALSLLNSNTYHLCLLDVMLPLADGFSVAEKIVQNKLEIPFIFLTAKTLKVEKLKGFKLGCDDYITKPVDEEELVARINAVLKRTRADMAPKEATLQAGISTFDYYTRILEINQVQYQLMTKEAELLQLLMSNKNKLLVREKALAKLWGVDDRLTRRNMDVVVSRLRKHLAPDKFLMISNIHNKGYILQERLVIKNPGS